MVCIRRCGGKGSKESSVFAKRNSRIIFCFIFTFLAAIFYACVQATLGGIPAHVYGEVLSRDAQSVKGAVVEKIALYPRKTVHSRERIMRKAILISPENAKGTVIISHGFMCTKEDVLFLGSALFPDYRRLVPDMRAHGENTEGQFCTLGRDEALDVAAAAQYVRNRPDLADEPLLIYGFSMGAVAAIEAQAKNPKLCDGLILDCPFEDSQSVINAGLDNMKFSFLGYQFSVPGRSLMKKYMFHPYVQSFVKTMLKAFAKMDTKNINAFVYPVHPAESIKKVSAPLLLIHCKNDEKIPVDSVKKIYNNAASKYKKLWVTNGRRHYDSFFYNPELYARRVAKFTSRLMEGRLTQAKKQKIIEDADPSALAVHVNVDRFTKIEERRKKRRLQRRK